ncbi:MAG: 30S ribosomal protein S8 [Hyphomicrobiales bacterium]|nr:30S ribosomal protein S8 [Hyphomicrobiales bacterium]
MSFSDPLGDMLTRIRNAQMRRKEVVRVRASSLCTRVLDTLKEQGFIRGYRKEALRPGINVLDVELKYHDGEPVIRSLRRVSRPGRRAYAAAKEIPLVYNGLGISILSTSRGVMSDAQARACNEGGEILCAVF